MSAVADALDIALFLVLLRFAAVVVVSVVVAAGIASQLKIRA